MMAEVELEAEVAAVARFVAVGCFDLAKMGMKFAFAVENRKFKSLETCHSKL